MNKTPLKFLALLILLGILGIGTYFLLQQTSSPKAQLANQPEITPTNIPTPTLSELTEIPSMQVGGNSYLDPQKQYVFLYPNDYSLDMQNADKMTRIYKKGPTQQGQTEMYDGAILTFEMESTQGQTLEKFVDTKIKDSTADGTLEITQPKKATTVHGYSGFTYTARGLGEATYMLLQKDPTSPYVLRITYMVADPNNEGYQKEVQSILETLQILK